jgi:hypothetical protein
MYNPVSILQNNLLDLFGRYSNRSYYCTMKEKKKMVKEPSGSLKVDYRVLVEVTNYCKENGIKVTFFATEALKDRLNKEKSK